MIYMIDHGSSPFLFLLIHHPKILTITITILLNFIFFLLLISHIDNSRTSGWCWV